MPPKNDVKFNNQAFITSYITEIIELLNLSNKRGYKEILRLDTSEKSLPETISLLTGKSDTLSLASLSTFQYSALTPKIRLFRVNNEDDSEYEFVFDKNNRYNTLYDNFIVGNNCGIKSINWILAGTNPASAEKTIEVKIEFYFDSINSFSGGNYDAMLQFWNGLDGNNQSLLSSPFDSKSKKITNNYWSLIYHPGKSPDEYSSPLFRIKAIVGWEQLDSNIINELFKNKQNINEEFYDSDLVMYLNLVQHNFAFNEDGSIKLTVNYIASLENSLFSSNFDLLKGLKESINNLKDVSLLTLQTSAEAQDLQPITPGVELETFNSKADVALLSKSLSLSQLERRVKFLTYLKSGQDVNALQKELIQCGSTTTLLDLGIPQLDYSSGEALDKVTELLETYSTSVDEAKNLIDTRTTELKQFYYSQLIKNLIKSQDRENKLFVLPLEEEYVKQWLNWKSGLNDKPKLRLTTELINNNDSSAVDSQLRNLNLERTSEDSLEWFEGDPDSFGEAQEQFRKEEETVKYKRIIFTTFGHLVDSALQIIKEKYSTDSKLIKEFNKNKIMFSTFSSADVSTPNKPINYSIADIPIEINFFINFLDNELYEKGAKEYPLFKFIKDLIIKAAEPSLESREVPNNETNKYANTSLVSTIISLGSPNANDHPLSNFFDDSLESVKFSSSINKTNLRPFYLSRTNFIKNKLFPFNYFIIYDKFNKDFSGLENKIDDEKRGIYHYTIAQDYGLVKAINFKKIDQPFLKESKSVGKKTIYLGQFRDLYNADIKMIGNNIYYPGMVLFIKPNVEFGKIISRNSKAPTFAQITGVGGYYTVTKITSEITDEAYTTTLECVFHSNDGLQPEEASNKSCNLTKLEQAGLYDSDGKVLPQMSLILSNLQEVAESVKGKEKEQYKPSITENITVFGWTPFNDND